MLLINSVEVLQALKEHRRLRLIPVVRSIDLLRKSRHTGNGAVTHRGNEIDAYREAPPSVTVYVLEHAEDLQTPNNMLNPQAG